MLDSGSLCMSCNFGQAAHTARPGNVIRSADDIALGVRHDLLLRTDGTSMLEIATDFWQKL